MKPFEVSFDGVAIASAAERGLTAASRPDDTELKAIRGWRAVLARGRRPLRPRVIDGGILVPLAHRQRVHGALRLRSGDDDGGVIDEEVALALGAACGQLVARAVLRAEQIRRERALAVAKERERIARDLHDSVCQLFVGIGMRASAYAADAPDAVSRRRMEGLSALADAGSRATRDSIGALLFLSGRRRGLRCALGEMVRNFQSATGVTAVLVERGEPGALLKAREEALLRVAREALMNVDRHSRATCVAVRLEFTATEVVLHIQDDGIGLGHRDPFGAVPHHFGLRGLQRLVDDVSGSIRVRNARPHGVVVECTVTLASGGTSDGADTRRHHR
ncbi:MAG: sensor histidine kinase [Acidimicrobiales bacterium]